MNRKFYWGIASLILIIGVVGIYFIFQPQPDPEPEKVYNLPSDADLKNMKEAREKAREANKPPPVPLQMDIGTGMNRTQNLQPFQTPKLCLQKKQRQTI